MKLLILLILAVAAAAQGLDPEALKHPATDTWPIYNGDYSGRRFSELSQINKDNVKSLTLAWAFQTHSATLKATPLQVNGILYFSVPDNVWAADALTGRRIWHYHRPSEGDHLASRGLAMYKDRLYFGTPDAHLICLNARDGKMIWDIVIADVKQGYYLSNAPLLVKDRLIVGTSGDSADVPHFLKAIDPVTGKELWSWSTVPKPGEPGSETWPDEDAMAHGGGATWMPGTYDPELNLLYWGTGNPDPVLAGVVRKGDNLFTCSIVAINPDNGKLVWHFQPSRHDTHDWDAVETPVLFEAQYHGKRRKVLGQASRNGYFFVLDRATGENLFTTEFVKSDWSKGVDSKGRPIPDPAKEPQLDGALVAMDMDGATNWMSPSYSPQTGLFYINAQNSHAIWYLNLTPEGKAEGHQGGTATEFWDYSQLLALDVETGKIKWSRDTGEGHNFAGILTTAGHLLFTGDVSGNLLALDSATGDVLWHVYAGGALNSSPMTYTLGGRQYVLTAADSVLYAWSLPQ